MIPDALTAAADLLTDPADMAPFLSDWTGQYAGTALAVALPRSTAQVQAVVRACAQAGLRIVPQGGNTSVAGGSVPGEGAGWIVLSLARMTALRRLDRPGRSVTVEAGMVLQSLQERLEPEGLLFPLSFGAKGSARIGGCLSTNAGGVNVLRYGNARELCLSLEAVLPDGTVIDTGAGLRKDNTGYDLRHLLIGAEGTLGIITAATLRLFALPKVRATAFLSVPGLEAALIVLNRLQDATGGGVEMFEYMPEATTRLVTRHFPHLRCPLDPVPPCGILVEVASTAAYDAEPGEEGAPRLNARVEEALAALFEEGLILDASLAQSIAQRDTLLSMREHVLESLMAEGRWRQYDISVPLAALPGFVSALEDGLPEGVRLHMVGHLGDGNLHLSILPGDAAGLDDTVYDLVAAQAGSISAEHGIGRSKAVMLAARKDPGTLAAMRLIKAALDPEGGMNPGAMLQVSLNAFEK
ncbi:FAD-binding oxidoreductase [Falsirhodobacter sp. 20TX0035]|uniref:FAD-binding oxidoreductase n=1 Tax=Falsirhodobacter sp. 20TX0035 TaxID=3022019 RepID=UPI00232F224D|nr:FAD-binding oxidoreductase [Falsirhodobacter sp. 20TX0035]MDB6454044.1 FAD-binding oxidoreductase [Falsirhodobacter sp. 20TX0035]